MDTFLFWTGPSSCWHNKHCPKKPSARHSVHCVSFASISSYWGSSTVWYWKDLWVSSHCFTTVTYFVIDHCLADHWSFVTITITLQCLLVALGVSVSLMQLSPRWQQPGILLMEMFKATKSSTCPQMEALNLWYSSASFALIAQLHFFFFFAFFSFPPSQLPHHYSVDITWWQAKIFWDVKCKRLA